MNDTEPSARDVAAVEDDLTNHKVKALIYNKQVSEKLTERLLAVARKAKIPVVAVAETQPAGVSFKDWMLGQLDALLADVDVRPGHQLPRLPLPPAAEGAGQVWREPAAPAPSPCPTGCLDDLVDPLVAEM